MLLYVYNLFRMIERFNENAPLVNAGMSIIYMWFLTRLVRDKKEARKQYKVPELWIFLKQHDSINVVTMLLIQNLWWWIAYNIKLSIDDEVFWKEEDWDKIENKLSERWFFKNWIRALEPKWKRLIKYTVLNWKSLKEKLLTDRVITAVYEDKSENTYTQNFIISLLEFENSALRIKTDWHKITKALETINDTLNSMVK